MKFFKSTLKTYLFHICALMIITTITNCNHNKKAPLFQTVAVANLSDKHNIVFKLKDVYVTDEALYNSEGYNILIVIEITNNTINDILFTSPANYQDINGSNSLIITNRTSSNRTNTTTENISGFYLLSSELQTGGFKLNSNINLNSPIKANKSEELVLWANCVVLRHFFKRAVPKKDQKAFQEIINFLKSENYNLIYVSTKESDACILSKSNNFKVTITKSITSELKNLGN